MVPWGNISSWQDSWQKNVWGNSSFGESAFHILDSVSNHSVLSSVHSKSHSIGGSLGDEDNERYSNEKGFRKLTLNGNHDLATLLINSFGAHNEVHSVTITESLLHQLKDSEAVRLVEAISLFPHLDTFEIIFPKQGIASVAEAVVALMAVTKELHTLSITNMDMNVYAEQFIPESQRYPQLKNIKVNACDDGRKREEVKHMKRSFYKSDSVRSFEDGATTVGSELPGSSGTETAASTCQHQNKNKADTSKDYLQLNINLKACESKVEVVGSSGQLDGESDTESDESLSLADLGAEPAVSKLQQPKTPPKKVAKKQHVDSPPASTLSPRTPRSRARQSIDTPKQRGRSPRRKTIEKKNMSPKLKQRKKRSTSGSPSRGRVKSLYSDAPALTWQRKKLENSFGSRSRSCSPQRPRTKSLQRKKNKSLLIQRQLREKNAPEAPTLTWQRKMENPVSRRRGKSREHRDIKGGIDSTSGFNIARRRKAVLGGDFVSTTKGNKVEWERVVDGLAAELESEKTNQIELTRVIESALAA